MLFTHVLAPNCIATLLEFSGSGMPVSVLCRDHEYTATYSSIVNLQMRREKKKGMPKKRDKNANLKMGLQMCMTFKSSMKSHTVLQHVIIYICMQKYSPIHFGNLVILFMVEVIIIIVSYDNVTVVLSVFWT